MTQVLPGTRHGRLNLWPDPDVVGRWRYLPLSPAPQRTEAGRPSITVIEAGGMVLVTIGAELAASDAELAVAKAAIAASAGMDAAAVDLRPAEVTVASASLVLTDASGTETPLATARPSSFPPYAGAFSAMAEGKAGKQLKAALSGEGGAVVLRYDIELRQTRAATATIRGEWPEDATMNAALENARLKIVVTADEGASAGLIQKAVQRVRAQAEDMGARVAGPARPTGMPDRALAGMARVPPRPRQEILQIDASASETETATTALRLQGEIAPWLK